MVDILNDRRSEQIRDHIKLKRRKIIINLSLSSDLIYLSIRSGCLKQDPSSKQLC